jgi:hypothetical protein
MRNGGRNSCRSAVQEEFWSRDYFSLASGPLSISWTAEGPCAGKGIELVLAMTFFRSRDIWFGVSNIAGKSRMRKLIFTSFLVFSAQFCIL